MKPQLPYQWRESILVLQIQVQPRAAKSEWAGMHGNRIKLRLNAPPVDNRANRECVNFLARKLGTAKSRVRVVCGQTSRSKTVEIEGPDPSCWNQLLANSFSPC